MFCLLLLFDLPKQLFMFLNIREKSKILFCMKASCVWYVGSEVTSSAWHCVSNEWSYGPIFLGSLQVRISCLIVISHWPLLPLCFVQSAFLPRVYAVYNMKYCQFSDYWDNHVLVVVVRQARVERLDTMAVTAVRYVSAAGPADLFCTFFCSIVHEHIRRSLFSWYFWLWYCM